MHCNRTLLKPPGKIPNVFFRKPNEKSAKTPLASHKSCEEMRGTDRLTASGRFSTPMFVFLWKKNQQCSFHPRLICQRSFHAIGIGRESRGCIQVRNAANSKLRQCHEFIFFFLISSNSRAELIQNHAAGSMLQLSRMHVAFEHVQDCAILYRMSSRYFCKFTQTKERETAQLRVLSAWNLPVYN